MSRRKILLFLKKKKQKDFISLRAGFGDRGVAERVRLACVWCGLAFLAACSSADPTLYTLTPTQGAVRSSVLRTIEVRRPGVAGYLDRSDVVLKNQSYKLTTNSQQRWAEPLGDMIGRVLAQDLTQRMPGVSVFSQSGAITAIPDVRLEVDIQSFDPTGDGTATLTAEYVLESGLGHRPVAARHVTLTAPSTGDAASLAAAESLLLGELADRIAADVGSGVT